MAAVEKLSFDEINTWKMDALKYFLKKRVLEVSGRKEELVTCVFAAAEQNMPICLDVATWVAQMQRERESLLKTHEGALADPSDLHNGWIGELNGTRKWPPILLVIQYYFVHNEGSSRERYFPSKMYSTEWVQRGKSVSLIFCQMVETNLYTSCW